MQLQCTHLDVFFVDGEVGGVAAAEGAGAAGRRSEPRRGAAVAGPGPRPSAAAFETHRSALLLFGGRLFITCK